MDKSLITPHPNENVADYEATIDRYIVDMERIQYEMNRDQREINELQLETRKMLSELLQAA